MCSKIMRFLVVAGLLIIPWVCSAASVTLVAPTGEGAVGSQIQAPILARDVEGMGALELEVTYDPGILEAVGVEPGPILSGLVDFNVVQPGRVKIAMATSQAVTGSGELFFISFRVTGAGKSLIVLEKVQAWDQANGQEMTVTVEPGSFKAGDSAAPASRSSYLWVGILLAALVIIGLGVFFRKKLFAAVGALRAGTVSTESLWRTRSAVGYPLSGLRCVACGQILSIDSMFCRTCGAMVTPPPPTVHCRECGRLMPEDSQFCPFCGKSVRLKEKTCPQCGKQFSEESQFCSACGAKLG